MCGRYVFYDIKRLEEQYPQSTDLELTQSYNVAPASFMPVVTPNDMQLMRWGLLPKWAKDEKIGYKLINARAEALFEKPIWKSVVTRNRCLVPANGFYEWKQTENGKQPYYIHPKDQELFMFAGLWERWAHDNEELHTYTIVTTAPNKEMEAIHNRMPVILYEEDYSQWLESSREEDTAPLLEPYRDGSLEIFPVSQNVNVVRRNDQELILPLNSK